MKIRIQHLPALLVVGALIAGAIYALWPRPVPVDVGAVSEGPLQVTVDEDGRTRVKDRYIVSAPLGGQLQRISLKAGDPIEARKTLLASIEPEDPTLLDARSRLEAEARVRAAEAASLQVESRLDEVREAHAVAVHDLERAKSLVTTRAVSQAEFDRAEHEERRAAHARRSAEFAVQVARFELELARTALVRTQPRDDSSDRQNLEVQAPLNGKILRVLQESARIVTPGMPLLEVGDPQNLEVEVDVLSADAARIESGARVFLEQWGGAQPLEGRVRLVEPAGFTKVSALGVEEQRVNVIVDFIDPPQRRATLGDAFRVEARIVTWESRDVRKIPVGGLFRSGERWAVYVVEESRARLRFVEIGHQNAVEAEVISGLELYDQVIVHPGDRISDGTYVAPRLRDRLDDPNGRIEGDAG